MPLHLELKLFVIYRCFTVNALCGCVTLLWKKLNGATAPEQDKKDKGTTWQKPQKDFLLELLPSSPP